MTLPNFLGSIKTLYASNENYIDKESNFMSTNDIINIILIYSDLKEIDF